ncbi:MAG TPA: alpha/beta hydrolase-fold protein [Chitinophagaceae bacterium]
MIKKASSFKRTMSLIVCTSMMCVSSLAQSHYSSAKLALKEYKISSRVLNEERTITIYKPPVHPEYKDVVSPVIYVLDSEFYADFISTMISFVSERFVTMPPITVVGIQNFGEGAIGRNRDLTPLIAKDSSIFKTSGGAEKFLQYIREEVFPFVEKDHKKTPYRVLIGHSLGGLLTMHTFLKHPEMFNAYLASDPSLWINNNEYMEIVKTTIDKTDERNKKLFFSTGNSRSIGPNAKKVDSLLQVKKIKKLSHQFTNYPNEIHTTVFMKSYYDGLHFIFQMDPFDANLKLADITWSLLENHYNKLSEIYGGPMKPEESLVNTWGYRFLNQEKNVNKALEFFKKNIENYPASANVYDSYAEALLVKGDKKNAMINYEKAFQMDPTNTAARDIAIKLKSEQ